MRAIRVRITEAIRFALCLNDIICNYGNILSSNIINTSCNGNNNNGANERNYKGRIDRIKGIGVGGVHCVQGKTRKMQRNNRD